MLRDGSLSHHSFYEKSMEKVAAELLGCSVILISPVVPYPSAGPLVSKKGTKLCSRTNEGVHS